MTLCGPNDARVRTLYKILSVQCQILYTNVDSTLLYHLLIQKLTNRLAALERSTVNDHQKSKYLAVLVPEFMSSEESGEDSENEDTYTVRAIPWRSSRVDNLFDQLDGEVLRSMSKQSKRQLKKRILSEEHSDRPIPSGKFPSWAFAEAQ